MSFISFSLTIVVDLFAEKVAGYTFISTTYETETSTYLWTVIARILHWNPAAQFLDSTEILTTLRVTCGDEFYIIFFVSYSRFVFVKDSGSHFYVNDIRDW